MRGAPRAHVRARRILSSRQALEGERKRVYEDLKVKTVR